MTPSFEIKDKERDKNGCLRMIYLKLHKDWKTELPTKLLGNWNKVFK